MKRIFQHDWRDLLADEQPTRKQAAAALAHLAERGFDTALIQDGITEMVGGLPEAGEDDDGSGERDDELATVTVADVIRQIQDEERATAEARNAKKAIRSRSTRRARSPFTSSARCSKPRA